MWPLAIALVAIALAAAGVQRVRDDAPSSLADAVTGAIADEGEPGGAAAEGGHRPGPRAIGYIPYWQQEAAVADVAANSSLLTTVSPWWYAPTYDGEVVEQHPAYTDTSDRIVSRLRSQGVQIMPTIANHRDGEWDFEVVPTLLADPELRARHVRALTALVDARGFDGIAIDYELLRARDRAGFTAFIAELAEALHADGHRLAVALHAQSTDAGDGEHNAAQDYAAIGAAADEIHLMTYDQHYDESGPGPIAPLPWIREVLTYTLERIPAHKVILGIGLFGYDWGGGPVAEGLQLTEADTRVAMLGRTPSYDQEAAAPFLRYRRDGVDHELWYEDERSVAAKLALVDEHDLGGAFFWRLGSVPDDIWPAAAGALGGAAAGAD